MKMISTSEVLAIFLLTFIISCNNISKEDKAIIVLTKIENRHLNVTERGALINNQKDGYWITIAKDSTIILECYYQHGKLNGPIKYYFDSGELMEEGYMKYGVSSGRWKTYYDSGKIRTEGQYLNSEKIGIWNYFDPNGRLDRKIEHSKDSAKVIIDNHLSIPLPGKNL